MSCSVRCTNCGFLSRRIKETRELVEAEEPFRILLESPEVGDHHEYEPYPECFAGAVNLKDEIGKIDGPRDMRILRIIGRFRECGSWTKWRPARTPKEHEEMGIVEKVQAIAAESQAKQDAFYRKYLRVMWATVIAAILSGILSGVVSGLLAGGHRP